MVDEGSGASISIGRCYKTINIPQKAIYKGVGELGVLDGHKTKTWGWAFLDMNIMRKTPTVNFFLVDRMSL